MKFSIPVISMLYGKLLALLLLALHKLWPAEASQCKSSPAHGRISRSRISHANAAFTCATDKQSTCLSTFLASIVKSKYRMKRNVKSCDDLWKEIIPSSNYSGSGMIGTALLERNAASDWFAGKLGIQRCSQELCLVNDGAVFWRKQTLKSIPCPVYCSRRGDCFASMHKIMEWPSGFFWSSE